MGTPGQSQHCHEKKKLFHIVSPNDCVKIFTNLVTIKKPAQHSLEQVVCLFNWIFNAPANFRYLALYLSRYTSPLFLSMEPRGPQRPSRAKATQDRILPLPTAAPAGGATMPSAVPAVSGLARSPQRKRNCATSLCISRTALFRSLAALFMLLAESSLCRAASLS